MKKILLTTVFMLGIIAINAQTLVGTTVTKKNVVLEEFTGIYCGFCPQGHKIGADMAKAYPGKIVRVHMHTGGYANPKKSTDPDFRTTHGQPIANTAAIKGYPAGMINRHVFSGRGQKGGKAMSRNYWLQSAKEEMAKDAIVNVGAKAVVDKAGKIKIDVEAYYTTKSSQSKNFIHVAILQNNVSGYQSGASGNPADVLPGGMYNHKEIFREFVTGQWGVEIPKTNKGDLFTKTFNFTLPASYKGKAITPLNTKIAVYVTETKDEVLNGVEIDVELPKEQQADLAFVNKTVKPADWCFKTFTPSLEVENKDAKDVTSFDLTASINGTSYKKSWTGTLKQGEKTIVNWDPIAITTQRVLTLTFDAPSNINGGSVFDINTKNNQVAAIVAPVVGLNNPANKLDINFERTGNYFILNPDGVSVRTLQAANIRDWTTPTGAWANSATSLWFDWVSWGANKTAEVFFDKLDLSSATAPSLVFHAAAAQTPGGNADLDVQISDDCGKTWKFANKSTATLKSREDAQAGFRFFPLSKDWKYHTVDLKSYAGKSEIILKFKVKSNNGLGSSLYIDNIRLSDKAVSIKPIDSELAGVSIYPNPTNGVTNVSLSLKKSSDVSIDVLNLAGQKVFNKKTSHSAGMVTINLPLKVKAGIYLVNITTEEGTTTKKLNVL